MGTRAIRILADKKTGAIDITTTNEMYKVMALEIGQDIDFVFYCILLHAETVGSNELPLNLSLLLIQMWHGLMEMNYHASRSFECSK